MKILVLAHAVPWPETSGTRMRMANIIRALSRVGEVDLFALTNGPAPGVDALRAALPVRRVEIAERPAADFPPGRRLRWLAAGRVPSPLAARDYGGVKARLERWAASGYDLVWYSRLETAAAFGRVQARSAIVDIDDLEDSKTAQWLDDVVSPKGARTGPSLRRAATWAQGVRNMRTWRGLQTRIAKSVDAVTVCSDLDRRRVRVRNAVVIPNGYAYQAQPAGRLAVGHPPVIIFPGLHLYPPNADGARYLAECIAPLVWRRLPEARIRIVGRADHRVAPLHAPPRVTVTGFVEEMRSELAAADLVAVPIRFGGGTRIKILEAFAHRIPVVSTSVGAEGIDAADRVHLLTADTPQAFADATVRLLSDQGLRRALVEAAYALFVERYRWDQIHGQIAALVAAVAGSTP